MSKPATNVELIAAALAAGGDDGGLRDLVRGRLVGRDDALAVLAADDPGPQGWAARIGPDLLDSGAATDKQIIAAARLLVTAAPKFDVGVNNGALGEFHAPVTFHQGAPLPPTRPAAG